MLYTDFYGIDEDASLYKPAAPDTNKEWERLKHSYKVNVPKDLLKNQ